MSLLWQKTARRNMLDYEIIRKIIKEENEVSFKFIKAVFATKEELSDFKKIFYKFRLVAIVVFVSAFGSTGLLRMFL